MGSRNDTDQSRRHAETLASVPMVDVAQACVLLDLSGSHVSATLKRLEDSGRIMRFDAEDGAAYPLFQFDMDEQRVHPAVTQLLALRTDEWGDQLALLSWMVRPNRSIGDARPCDRIQQDGDAIVRSFRAEIAEPLAG